MPPKIKYSEKQIIDAAIVVVQKEGYPALNARSVAKELGCSTQPVFRVFDSMEQLKVAVIREANAVYNSYIEASKATASKPYKATGLAYLRFAREEKELFRLLFMRNRSGEVVPDLMTDDNLDYILAVIQDTTGFDRETSYLFHLQMWIYTHGLAAMIATDFVDFTEADTDRLLTEAFFALSNRFSKKSEESERRCQNHEKHH